jgi:hypothetical protein
MSSNLDELQAIFVQLSKMEADHGSASYLSPMRLMVDTIVNHQSKDFAVHTLRVISQRLERIESGEANAE